MHSYKWNELQITEEVIEQVDQLDGYGEQPIMGDG